MNEFIISACTAAEHYCEHTVLLVTLLIFTVGLRCK